MSEWTYVEFFDMSGDTFGVDLLLDAVSVNLTAVPEPGFYATGAALALAGFGVWRRRSR